MIEPDASAQVSCSISMVLSFWFLPCKDIRKRRRNMNTHLNLKRMGLVGSAWFLFLEMVLDGVLCEHKEPNILS